MQEVFVRAIRSGSQFRGSSSPTTWLYRMTTNYCLNLLRDTQLHGRLVAEKLPGKREGTEGGPEARLYLSTVLPQIPEELRDVAVCFFVDEMTQSETADFLGLSRRTVGYRLQAFRHIARSLARTEESDCDGPARVAS